MQGRKLILSLRLPTHAKHADASIIIGELSAAERLEVNGATRALDL